MTQVPLVDVSKSTKPQTRSYFKGAVERFVERQKANKLRQQATMRYDP